MPPKYWLRNPLQHHLEVGMANEVRDISPAAGKIVVDAKHIVALLDETLAQMRAKKTGAAGDQHLCHLNLSLCLMLKRVAPTLAAKSRAVVLRERSRQHGSNRRSANRTRSTA